MRRGDWVGRLQYITENVGLLYVCYPRVEVNQLTHKMSELNQWTGLFSAIAAAALMLCVYCLGRLDTVITRFWQDYRKVNDLDQREEMESQF
jgi:hypothetical protein